MKKDIKENYFYNEEEFVLYKKLAEDNIKVVEYARQLLKDDYDFILDYDVIKEFSDNFNSQASNKYFNEIFRNRMKRICKEMHMPFEKVMATATVLSTREDPIFIRCSYECEDARKALKAMRIPYIYNKLVYIWEDKGQQPEDLDNKIKSIIGIPITKDVEKLISILSDLKSVIERGKALDFCPNAMFKFFDNYGRMSPSQGMPSLKAWFAEQSKK